MKNLIVIVCFLLTILVGCSKEESMDYGQITGPDMSLCFCCGGWFINIDGNTYRFFDIPENSNLDIENETFPINVRLDWNNDENQCMGDEIVISAIKKE